MTSEIGSLQINANDTAQCFELVIFYYDVQCSARRGLFGVLRMVSSIQTHGIGMKDSPPAARVHSLRHGRFHWCVLVAGSETKEIRH